MNKKNILIFGSRKITINFIEHLIQQNKYNLVGVITHDEERDRVFCNELVSEFCARNNIFNTRIVKEINPDFVRSFNPDIILSIYYRKIFKKNIIEIPSLGIINVHPAKLPKGRGPAPSLWDILRGEKETATTLHYVDDGIDSGDIIDQKIVHINDMTGFELNKKLMDESEEILKKNLDSIMSKSNNRIKQDHSVATYCLPFKKCLRNIVWDNPNDIINRIRAFAKPYDGAIAEKNDKSSIVVWDAKIINERVKHKPPGFFELVEDKIVVQTETNPILICKWNLLKGNIGTCGRFSSFPIE